MKKNNLKWLMTVALGATIVALTPVQAGTNPQQAAVSQAVEKTPVTEWAPKAAALVSTAKAENRQDVALATIQTMDSTHPAVAVAVVGAIAKAAPEVAAAAAAKAAQLSPKQAVSIARAAARNAPKYASQIAAAVARVAPNSASSIAEMVMFTVPSASTQIADAVAAAVPESKASIASLTPARRSTGSVAIGSGDYRLAQIDARINGTEFTIIPKDDGGSELLLLGFEYDSAHGVYFHP